MIMLMSVLLPDESQLCIDRIEMEDDAVVLSVSSTKPTGLCPLCGTPSDRVHSHYQRHPVDLPLAGCAVGLDMNVRMFFCDNSDCGRTIFTERLPSVVAPYAGRTHRLADQQREVAFSMGGLSMAVSHDTLLRLIRKAPEPGVQHHGSLVWTSGQNVRDIPMALSLWI